MSESGESREDVFSNPNAGVCTNRTVYKRDPGTGEVVVLQPSAEETPVSPVTPPERGRVAAAAIKLSQVFQLVYGSTDNLSSDPTRLHL